MEYSGRPGFLQDWCALLVSAGNVPVVQPPVPPAGDLHVEQWDRGSRGTRGGILRSPHCCRSGILWRHVKAFEFSIQNVNLIDKITK